MFNGVKHISSILQIFELLKDKINTAEPIYNYHVTLDFN